MNTIILLLGLLDYVVFIAIPNLIIPFVTTFLGLIIFTIVYNLFKILVFRDSKRRSAIATCLLIMGVFFGYGYILKTSIALAKEESLKEVQKKHKAYSNCFNDPNCSWR